MADEAPVQSNKIDEYLLLSPVATGKTTQVWEAIHEATNMPFALKMLLPEAMKDPEERALLKHEAKVAQSLEHPNLNRCHGVVIRKTECYLIMDMFKAPNLKQFIFNDHPGVLERFTKLVEGICAGLGHMHEKGWVHLDLKPDNILLARSGEMRIIDFSLGQRVASSLQIMLAGKGKKGGVIKGTRSYLAPETIRKQPPTAATDIYSLGVIFFECLTGTTPFKGDTPADLLKKHIAAEPPLPSMYNKDVTPEMDRFIHKMLAKKPKSRFQSMQEVLTEFGRIQPFKLPETDEAAAEQQAAQAASDAADGGQGADERELDELMANRRGSREDALITALLERNPSLKARHEAIKVEQIARKAAKEAELKRRLDAAAAKGKPGAKPAEEKPKPAKKPAAAPQPMAGQFPPGMMQMPPGYPYPQMPPGYGYPQMPPGYPPQQMPYGMPGMPPGGFPPQGFPPGQYPPGAMPPQSFPPGQFPPGQFPPGQFPPGVMPPGQFPPGQFPPGVMPPQGSPPGQFPPGAPMPVGYPPRQSPVPGPPAASAPPAAVPQPPAPAAPAPAKKPKDDLEFMLELPDID